MRLALKIANFLSKTKNRCLSPGKIATGSLLPKTRVLKRIQTSEPHRRLLKTQIAGPLPRILLQQVRLGRAGGRGPRFYISNKAPSAAASPRAACWEQISANSSPWPSRPCTPRPPTTLLPSSFTTGTPNPIHPSPNVLCLPCLHTGAYAVLAA